MEPRITRDARLCKTAFRVLDADQDGYITQPDLERILLAAPGGGAEVAASRARHPTHPRAPPRGRRHPRLGRARREGPHQPGALLRGDAGRRGDGGGARQRGACA